MEALDYKEAQRMCKSYPDCKGCPLIKSACGLIRCIGGYSDADIQCAIKVVEQWSKEHPIKTNAQKFKEVFGDKAIYAISSPNVQALKNWLDEPYKEPGGRNEG